jgi:hypothetical protein
MADLPKKPPAEDKSNPMHYDLDVIRRLVETAQLPESVLAEFREPGKGTK